MNRLFKKMIAIFLCLVVLFSSVSLLTFAVESKQVQYPNIYIKGQGSYIVDKDTDEILYPLRSQTAILPTPVKT